ncbi:MAG: DUF3592 domain-containing protein, partial [Clostridia bacterium]|nr:DUF3592 domain-containing protein [Clostridia bacterium]
MSEESKLRFKYNKIFLFAAIAMIIVALGSIAGGIACTVHDVNETKDYVKVDATVVDIAEVYHKGSHGGNSLLYSEVVEYVVDGKTYRAQNTSSSNMPKKKGSKMTIAYDPNDPSKYTFPKSDVESNVFLFVFGAIFGFAGVV